MDLCKGKTVSQGRASTELKHLPCLLVGAWAGSSDCFNGLQDPLPPRLYRLAPCLIPTHGGPKAPRSRPR